MPTYKYVAVGPDGKNVKETAEAPSEDVLRNQLLLRNLEVTQLKQRKSFNELELTPQRVPKQEVMHFSRQMAVFLRAGIPVIDALNIIKEEVIVMMHETRVLLTFPAVDVKQERTSRCPNCQGCGVANLKQDYADSSYSASTPEEIDLSDLEG